jgi:hypothetical protein
VTRVVGAGRVTRRRRAWGVLRRAAASSRPSRWPRWRSSTVEHLICNQAVVGSIPIASFEDAVGRTARRTSGEVPEWPKGADCKSAGVSLRRFESSPLHTEERRARPSSTAIEDETTVQEVDAGIAQLVRASAFQAEGRGFESRFPLHAPAHACRARAQVAQSAEHVLGKDEVGGSIPLLGFRWAGSGVAALAAESPAGARGQGG